MTRLFLWAALALILEGCQSDCSVQEATGSLSKFAINGCSSSGSREDDRGLGLRLDMLLIDDLYDELDIHIPPPLVLGMRGSATVVGRSSYDITVGYGSGVADYIVTGVRRKENSADAIVDLDVSCPNVTSVFGEGSFKGHASVIVFDFGIW